MWGCLAPDPAEATGVSEEAGVAEEAGGAEGAEPGFGGGGMKGAASPRRRPGPWL